MTNKLHDEHNLELEDDEIFVDPLNDELDPEPVSKPKATAAAEPDDGVPKGYEGKSMEDIIKMHENAQKQISRQGNELGELRKLTDQILKQTAPKPKPKEEADWDYNPKGAVEELVDERVNEIEDKLAGQARQREFEKFQEKHTDYATIAASEEFRNWVVESPYRTRLYQAADSHDYDAADDLFTEWEARQEAADPSNSSEKDEKSDILKKTSMERGGSAGGKKKIYRRADLVKLRIEKPDVYDARYDEISLAYREGRVR